MKDKDEEKQKSLSIKSNFNTKEFLNLILDQIENLDVEKFPKTSIRAKAVANFILEEGVEKLDGMSKTSEDSIMNWVFDVVTSKSIEPLEKLEDIEIRKRPLGVEIEPEKSIGNMAVTPRRERPLKRPSEGSKPLKKRPHRGKGL